MISPVENISSIACIVYGATLYWMIRTVRKQELEFVRNALTNPFWPRTSIKFFITVYRRYYDLTKSKILIARNGDIIKQTAIHAFLSLLFIVTPVLRTMS